MSMTDSFFSKLLLLVPSAAAPVIVKVEPVAQAGFDNCYFNVAKQVESAGGTIRYGWSLHQTTMLCEAEHHAVWERQDGTLIDVTPRRDGQLYTHFATDQTAAYKGKHIDNVRLNITGNSLVDDLIVISEVQTDLLNTGTRLSDGILQISSDKLQAWEQLQRIKAGICEVFWQGGSAESFCFCQSGMAYARCHGEGIAMDMAILKNRLANSIGN